MKLIPCLLIFILCNACNPDKSKQINKKAINFSTNDASEMFFKNIRQSSYDIEERKEVFINVYRHESYNACKEKECKMSLAIVHNWKDDLAYILIEPREPFADAFENKIEITSQSLDATSEDTLVYYPGNVRSQAEFVTNIYNEVLKGKTLAYLIKGEKIMMSRTELEGLRITSADFYRLVNAYKPN